jgi:hypothetical protein
MSPRFIRDKPASSVKKTKELEAFLDSCHDQDIIARANNAFDELAHNYLWGDHKVEKDRWPPYYKQKWGINNLYVAELGGKQAWRLTYTLVAEAGITVLCLEIMNHNDYNKRFGYR